MKSTPVRVAGSILTKSMRVRTLSLSRTLMMWPSGLSSCERPEALVLGTSLRAWVRTPPSSLEFHAAHLYPWPSWSKALDLSPNLFGGVGSNPTGCIWTDWRNGSASDSSPEGYVFESRIGHSSTEPRWSGGWTSVPQPFRDGAVRFRLGCDCWIGVVVITSALHAVGHRFEPGIQ